LKDFQNLLLQVATCLKRVMLNISMIPCNTNI